MTGGMIQRPDMTVQLCKDICAEKVREIVLV